MNFPSRPPKPIQVTDLMENALGVPVSEAHLSRDMILVLQTEEDVREAVPDLNIVSKISGCINL